MLHNHKLEGSVWRNSYYAIQEYYCVTLNEFLERTYLKYGLTGAVIHAYLGTEMECVLNVGSVFVNTRFSG